MAQPLILPNKPTNRIFTGVAGTGKTYHLLQLQRLYEQQLDDKLEATSVQIKHNMLAKYSWVEVICAVFLLENRTLSVPEIKRHPLMQDKIYANGRDANVYQTLWTYLGKHSHPNSSTVHHADRSANYYFDKEEDSRWYLLSGVKEALQDSLAELIELYQPTYNERSKQAQTSCQYNSRTCFVSFHQSYGYDEFVEGIRPHIDPDTGQMRYHIQAGVFIQLCQKAMADPDHRYAMFIDEINRANTAQVFGDLMSVIEPDKRAGQCNTLQVTLAYSSQQIVVPSNIDIYATMNTQDHSLTALDDAFRRRFDFVQMHPDSSILPILADKDGNSVDLSAIMEAINQRMAEQLGSAMQLGHAYFYNIDTLSLLAIRLARQILPQLIHNVCSVIAPTQHYKVLSYILYGDTDSISSQMSLLQPNHASQYLSTDLSNTLTISDSLINIVDTVEREQFGLADSTSLNLTSMDMKGIDIENAGFKDLAADEPKQNAIAKDGLIYLTATPYHMIYQHNVS